METRDRGGMQSGNGTRREATGGPQGGTEAARAEGERGAHERGGIVGFFQRAVERLRGHRGERERALHGRAEPSPERRGPVPRRLRALGVAPFDHDRDHGYVPRVAHDPAAAERRRMAEGRAGWTEVDMGAGVGRSTGGGEGMRSGAARAAARGRDESSRLDSSARVGDEQVRATGRHYGRSGWEHEGPDAAVGELQRRHAPQGVAVEEPGEFVRDDELSLGDAMPARALGAHDQGYGDGLYRPQSLEGHGTAVRRGRRAWQRGAMARDAMTRNPVSVRATETLERVARVMVDQDCGIVPVVDDDNRLLGVVTDRDIVCRAVARGQEPRALRAGDVMSDEVECVTEDDGLDTVLRLMGEHQVRRVPVVARGDRLVGILAMGDIAREADADEALQGTFNEISAERGFWTRLR